METLMRNNQDSSQSTYSLEAVHQALQAQASHICINQIEYPIKTNYRKQSFLVYENNLFIQEAKQTKVIPFCKPWFTYDKPYFS